MRIAAPGIAAAALLAIGVAGYFTLRTEKAQRPELSAARMVATGVGARDSLRLPDGTHVVLGPLSSIRMTADYGAQRRDVEVRGDVYLEVMHDSSKPFTVHTAGASIQDIGTRFSVRTDAAEGVAVSVVEGSVSLRSSNAIDAPAVILKAGDRGLLLANGQTVSSRITPEDLAWMRGQLVFRAALLPEVAASLRRWYGIQLRMNDKSLAGQHLTATFSDEPPDRVLEVIRLALGATMERHGDTAIIRSADGGVRLK